MIDIANYLERSQAYLNDRLIPFWQQRVEEPEFGGFQSNYDKDGRPDEIQEKSFLAHARIMFSIAFVMRQGFAFKDGEALLQRGYAFMQQHFLDPMHGGYYWILNKDGSVLDDNKILYGHSFMLYALSEWALLSGDVDIKADACALFDLMQDKARDTAGGYIEHFKRDFTPRPARGDVGCHKSLDVHMHLMEAFTTLYELTSDGKHKTALDEVSALIHQHMIDPEYGTGIAMFTQQWQPIANVELDIVWGADRFDENGKSVDITSYGHNIELAWLYAHMLQVRGIDLEEKLPWMKKVYEHTYADGLDWQHGGIYCEGHKSDGVTESHKEFWQQAEAMIGFLDAYMHTADEKYLEAYALVQDFVDKKVINWDLGEYYPLLDREGNVLWDYMSTNWKICYHTLRASALVVRKLEKIEEIQKKQTKD
ncbi:MAG: AGE family epimerase/isomerase [Planctomycetes bacterium]|nr:AGE family epimerase/isomerase [Planctomycetota bacterium]